jgi:hypothetical protein
MCNITFIFIFMVVMVYEKQEKKEQFMLNNGVFHVGLSNVCMCVCVCN